MNISPSRNSDAVPIKSASGSKDSDSGPKADRQLSKPSMSGTFPSGQARSLGHSSTFGMPRRPRPCSMGCNIQGPFSFQTNGGIGQTVIDADGNAVAWTTDEMVAQVICGLMNEYTNTQEQGI